MRCRALRQGSGRRNAAGGLDDWEVKIADYVRATAKPATRHVGFVGERCEKGSLVSEIELKAGGQ